MTGSETERFLAIDYGEARIGTAVSDPLGITARGLETIRWNGRDNTYALNRLTELVRDLGITTIIMGLPRRTDGKPGESETHARALGEELASRTGRPVIYWDERYTTVLAGRVLREAKIRGRQRRDVVDQVAAEIILQEYLESRRKV
jgi:putative Holliday junction resolvase